MARALGRVREPDVQSRMEAFNLTVCAAVRGAVAAPGRAAMAWSDRRVYMAARTADGARGTEQFRYAPIWTPCWRCPSRCDGKKLCIVLAARRPRLAPRPN